MGHTLITLWISVILCLAVDFSSAQLVNTTGGVVQGTKWVSRGGREFSAFVGIPYAKPPVGSLRFQAPVPVDPWTGVRNATQYGPICPQVSTHYTNSTGEEDCLTINVFTHKKFDDKPEKEEDSPLLPVLVFVHGGFFMFSGSAIYGPRYFMDKDVLFVSFNYRLGILGFLGTEDTNAPGNSGIKDQLLAFKWIQNNIKAFGGDPSRVTLYGESAGAAGVHYHMLSPESQGLFSAAICGSGVAYKVYSQQVHPLKSSQKIAKELGCGQFVGDNAQMIKCLQTVDVSLFAAHSNEFAAILKDPLRMASPLTETNSSGPNPFITRHPYEVITEGHQNPVPWLVGVNSGEGLTTTFAIRKDPVWINKINSEWTNSLAPDFFLYDNRLSNLTEAITTFYLDSFRKNRSVDFQADFVQFTDMCSDRYYIHPSLEAVEIQSKLSPVFLYFNDYNTQINPGPRVEHAEELQLLMSDFNDTVIDTGHQDFEQSLLMIDIWVQFATDPFNMSHNSRPWKPVNSSDFANINSFIFRNPERGFQGIGTLPHDLISRYNFWKYIGIPSYEKYDY